MDEQYNMARYARLSKAHFSPERGASGNKHEDPYELLAMAICKQAADDFLEIAQTGMIQNYLRAAKSVRQENVSLMRFFEGGWFLTLSGMDELQRDDFVDSLLREAVKCG